MSYTQRVAWETMRTIDSATFTGSYQAVGTALSHPSIIFKMVNNSNRLITISVDGVNDVDVLPSGSFFLYDELKVPSPSIQFLPQGTQVYVKGTAGGTGLIYLVTQYIIVN